MKAVKVKIGDSTIVNFIIKILFENSGKLTANHLQKLLSDDRTYLFAVTSDQNVIGYALAYRFHSLYSPDDYLAYLYDIEILPSHRRKGAGRLLMETLLAYLKSDGVTELWLGTATDNIEGQALFTSTGGIKSGETFNDFTFILPPR